MFASPTHRKTCSWLSCFNNSSFMMYGNKIWQYFLIRWIYRVNILFYRFICWQPCIFSVALFAFVQITSDQLWIIMANNFLLIIYTIQQKSFIRINFSVSFHVCIYIYVWTTLSFGWFVVVVGLLHYRVVAYDWHFHKISYFVILHFFWSLINQHVLICSVV